MNAKEKLAFVQWKIARTDSLNTVETYKDFQSFDSAFKKSTYKQLLQYALSDLWLIDHLHYQRHKSLRSALMFLLLAVISMFISAGVFLIGLIL